MPYNPVVTDEPITGESAHNDGAVAELDRTSAVLNSVTDRFDVLEKRLDPILRPSNAAPSESSLTAVKPERESLLVDRTRSVRDRLEMLDARITHLTSRVQL